MPVLDIVLIVVVPVAAVMLMRLAPRILSTVTWSASGEPGSLLVRGFMPRSLRLRRSADLQAVISRLALVTRLNLPLGPALEAAAASDPRRIGRVLREIGQSVLAGRPVYSALEKAVRGCPIQLVVALRQAEQRGQLSCALAAQERAITGTIDASTRSTAHARHAVVYVTFMLLFAAAMVSWIMIFLMPKFHEIFLDFDVPMPRITLVLIAIAVWFARWGWLLLVAVGLVLCGTLIVARASTRNEGGVAARWVARLRWALPILRAMDYGLGMARVIRLMALEMRGGAPLAFTAPLALVVSPTNHLRHRLTVFAREIAIGVPPHEAARRAKLGDVFVCALKMVEQGEDPERVLGHAADCYEAIAYRWWHALAALSGPMVTVAMAAVVAFIALALFLPLVALINATAEVL